MRSKTKVQWWIGICLVCGGLVFSQNTSAAVKRTASTGKPIPEKTSAPSPVSIKAASIQIVDGDKVKFRGLSGVSGSMNPGATKPKLPCIWIIRSISDRNRATAKSLGVLPGNSYMQKKDGNEFTSLGVLPARTSFHRIKSIDPSATDEQLLSDYAGMLELEPWNRNRGPTTASALIAALKKGSSLSTCSAAYDLIKEDVSLAANLLPEAYLDKDPHVRRCAARALGSGMVKDLRSPGLLLTDLGDPDPDVRRSVADALGNMREPRAVEPLIPLLKDSNYLIRMSVAYALGSIRDPRGVEPLVAEFTDEARGDYRYSLIKALGDIGDPRAIPVLKKEAEIGSANDTSGSLRRAARKALEQIKESQSGN
jgi:hypothetical protein